MKMAESFKEESDIAIARAVTPSPIDQTLTTNKSVAYSTRRFFCDRSPNSAPHSAHRVAPAAAVSYPHHTHTVDPGWSGLSVMRSAYAQTSRARQ